MENLKIVYVYSDGEQHKTRPIYKSHAYEIRRTCLCTQCGTDFVVHYAEPFASCDCGTTEWYY
jgi:hypothetical protein